MHKCVYLLLLSLILCSCSSTNSSSIFESESSFSEESTSILDSEETSESGNISVSESQSESNSEGKEEIENPLNIPKYPSHPTSEPEINKILSTINPLGEISKVWNYYRGDGVTVAVIDSGFDIDHPEFYDANNKSCISEKSAFISSSNNGDITKLIGKENVKITDGDSHGTMCAGILGSQVNNYGITGIAPNVELLLIKIDKKAFSMAEAFKYAADNGAKVISTSLGTYPNKNGQNYGDIHFEAGLDVSTIFNESINYAYKKGVTIVAATGNDRSTSLTYPAACKNVIGAGGLNGGSTTQIWDEGGEGSNYNGSTIYVDVFAPSSNIYAPGYDVQTNSHTFWNNGKGTSFAAPIIAGAAALYFEKYPSHTNLDFENTLKNTCQNISSYNNNKNMGYGKLCVNKLLNIEEDFKQLTFKPSTNITQSATKLSIIDEAGWDFRTLHLFDIKFKNGYGLSDFENYMARFYGKKIPTSSYKLEGTEKGWAYTDEGYIGDYYICVGNKDHAIATTYDYIFPHWVKSLKYQIVNNSNWLPEGGLELNHKGYTKINNTYFWYKSSSDTGLSTVIGNEYKHTFEAAKLIINGVNEDIETYSIFDYFETNRKLYFDSNKKYQISRVLMNEDLVAYQ